MKYAFILTNLLKFKIRKGGIIMEITERIAIESYMTPMQARKAISNLKDIYHADKEYAHTDALIVYSFERIFEMDCRYSEKVHLICELREFELIVFFGKDVY